MFRKLGRWVFRSLAFYGFFSLLFSLALIAMVVSFRPEKPTVPDQAVLVLDFANTVHESPNSDPFRQFVDAGATDILTLASTLQDAAGDARVKGLVADLSFVDLNLVQVQELRQAIHLFRKSGKFAVAYTDTFTEGGTGNAAYYLASAFDEVWMQPSGMLGLTGLAVEVPYLRGLFDKIGIRPEFVKRTNWKSAADSFTDTGISPENTTTLQGILDSLYRQMVADVGADRKLKGDPAVILKDGPYLAQEAVQKGLIDRVGYGDEVKAAVEERLDGADGHEWLDVASYASLKDNDLNFKELSDDPMVGIIYLDGTIMRDEGESSPLTGATGIVAPAAVADAFERAATDDQIKAVVLRIDSPGGSYVASDTIRRAVQRVKDAGKPVYVSMGNMAASGGYFVGMEATRVLANPASLVGSIGVFGGKMTVRELTDKIGVNLAEVALGDKALMWSGTRPFTEVEKAAFARTIDFVFEDFSAKARAARKLDEANWPGLVGGRVLTGADGVKAGLVDGTGTFLDAIRGAREQAGIKEGEGINMILYPHQLTPLEAIRDALKGGQFTSAAKMLSQAVMAQLSLPETRYSAQVQGLRVQ